MCCITPFAPLKRVLFAERVDKAICPRKIRKVMSRGGNLIRLGRWSPRVNEAWSGAFRSG